MMDETSDSRRVDAGVGPAPYANPYLAGLALGGALLASFLILGAGLGASAVPIRCGAWLESLAAPAHAQQSEFFGQKYLSAGAHPLRYYLSFMFLGILLGGWPVGAGRAAQSMLRSSAAKRSAPATTRPGAGRADCWSATPAAGQRLHLGPGPDRRCAAGQRQPRVHGLRVRRRIRGRLFRQEAVA